MGNVLILFKASSKRFQTSGAKAKIKWRKKSNPSGITCKKTSKPLGKQWKINLAKFKTSTGISLKILVMTRRSHRENLRITRRGQKRILQAWFLLGPKIVTN